MSEFGINSTGFRTKTFSEIRDSLKEKLILVKDPKTNENLQVDFDENDPFVLMVNAFCEELSTCWEILEKAYSQYNPQVAVGASLSSLVQLNGIVRKKGSPSTVVLTFAGDSGTLVPEGTIVTDEESSVLWQTTEDATIGSSKSVEVLAESQENGVFEADPGTINTVISSIAGVNSVVNRVASTPGSVDETDADLRVRRSFSTQTPARGIAECLYSAIMNIEGVKDCKIYCNRKAITDCRGIPPKSIAVVVDCEETEQLNLAIAKEIFNRAGIVTGFYGDTNVLFTDTIGVQTVVRFSRPTPVDIDVAVSVVPTENEVLPNDYAEKIKSAIINYAKNGVYGLGIETPSFDPYGFPIGENVVASKLYTPVNSVGGMKITSLRIARHGSALSTNDIEIGWNEIASFSASNIYVQESNA